MIANAETNLVELGGWPSVEESALVQTCVQHVYVGQVTWSPSEPIESPDHFLAMACGRTCTDTENT